MGLFWRLWPKPPKSTYPSARCPSWILKQHLKSCSAATRFCNHLHVCGWAQAIYPAVQLVVSRERSHICFATRSLPHEQWLYKPEQMPPPPPVVFGLSPQTGGGVKGLSCDVTDTDWFKSGTNDMNRNFSLQHPGVSPVIGELCSIFLCLTNNQALEASSHYFSWLSK